MMNGRQATKELSEMATDLLKKYHEATADVFVTYGADEEHFTRLDEECELMSTRIGYLTKVALGGDRDGD